MHRRSFIVGIGVGIIIGVLLLELFTIGEKSQKQLNAIEQQINGGEASPSPSPAPTDSELVSPQAPDAPTSDSEVNRVESPDQLEEPTVEPVETENVAAPDAVESPKMAAIFRVHPGDSITETANRLENSGLFSENKEFVDYFKNNGVEIRAGFFYVEEQMSLSDLKKLFTSKPLTESEANEQISTKGLSLIQ